MQSVSKSECVCACVHVYDRAFMFVCVLVHVSARANFSKAAQISHSDPECTYRFIQCTNVNPSIIFDG